MVTVSTLYIESRLVDIRKGGGVDEENFVFVGNSRVVQEISLTLNSVGNRIRKIGSQNRMCRSSMDHINRKAA